jgi:cell division protein FtsB
MQEVRVIRQGPNGPIVSSASVSDVPQTREELGALNMKRSELSDQMAGLRGRKARLTEEWHQASGARRNAIQERIDAVDAQFLALESSVDQINAQIAAAPPSAMIATAVSARRDPGEVFLNRISNDLIPIIAILSVFVFAPLAIAISRLIWKRASAPSQRVLLGEQAAMQRLDQLQQSVDTMAIEVERISEGQRFVSKLLNAREQDAAKLPADAR